MVASAFPDAPPRLAIKYSFQRSNHHQLVAALDSRTTDSHGRSAGQPRAGRTECRLLCASAPSMRASACMFARWTESAVGERDRDAAAEITHGSVLALAAAVTSAPPKFWVDPRKLMLRGTRKYLFLAYSYDFPGGRQATVTNFSSLFEWIRLPERFT
eukprot:2185755-Pleurochrysis_carterae.AAC.1